MTLVRTLTTLAAALAFAAAAVSSPEPGRIHDRDTLFATLDAAAARAYTDRIHALARDGDTAALGALLGDLHADESLAEVARTALVFKGLLALGGLAPDATVRPLVERHAGGGERVWTWYDDEGHRAAVPLFDTAAAAQYALREWRRHDARTQAGRALQRNTFSLSDTYGPNTERRADPDAWHAGLADAFAAAPDSVLARERDAILAALEAGWEVERIALTTTVRLGDHELAAALLHHGRPGEVVRMMPQLAGAFPADDAAALFRAAAERDAIAHAALAALAPHAARSPQLLNWLIMQLDDARLGVPAASALARGADAAVVARLAERLRDDTAPRMQNRAALSLYLSGRPDAADALAEFAADPSSPDNLRRQIGVWLR